jgi:steroid delta-isomerase-like uncharacterized protein
MSVEENKAVVNAFVEQVWNQKNVAAVDAFVAPDYVGHNLANPDETSDREGAKQSIAYFLSAFPDCHVTYDDVFAEGDMVAIRMTVRGTHKGEFAGVAPTGKEVTFMGLSHGRIADGKIAEEWEMYDTPGLMRQIGAKPE